MKKIKCFVSSATKANNRDFNKPNEDYILYDEEAGIYILLDGVTRIHSEYTDGTSAAFEVGKIFAERVYEYLSENIFGIQEEDVPAILKVAVIEGNIAIEKYRLQKSLQEWGYYPATVGIVALIYNKTLHYICAGDSLGVVLRGNSKLFFGEQQSIKAIDINNISKEIRYSTYCNHPENELSYALFNGDSSLIESMEQSFLDIHPGDVIIFASDGVGNYIKYEKTDKLKAVTPSEMTELSVVYDQPPYAKYSDDKAIIKIECIV